MSINPERFDNATVENKTAPSTPINPIERTKQIGRIIVSYAGTEGSHASDYCRVEEPYISDFMRDMMA